MNFQIFINEDNVILQQALLSMQKQLQISTVSESSTEQQIRETSATSEITSLTQLLTCSICFTFLSRDMHPKQCSDCLNYMMCDACVKRLNGKCSFCKSTRIKFIDIPP